MVIKRRGGGIYFFKKKWYIRNTFKNFLPTVTVVFVINECYRQKLFQRFALPILFIVIWMLSLNFNFFASFFFVCHISDISDLRLSKKTRKWVMRTISSFLLFKATFVLFEYINWAKFQRKWTFSHRSSCQYCCEFLRHHFPHQQVWKTNFFQKYTSKLESSILVPTKTDTFIRSIIKKRNSQKKGRASYFSSGLQRIMLGGFRVKETYRNITTNVAARCCDSFFFPLLQCLHILHHLRPKIWTEANTWPFQRPLWQ